VDTGPIIAQFGAQLLGDLAPVLAVAVGLSLAVTALFIGARLAIRAFRVVDDERDADGVYRHPETHKWWGLD